MLNDNVVLSVTYAELGQSALKSAHSQIKMQEAEIKHMRFWYMFGFPLGLLAGSVSMFLAMWIAGVF